MKFRFRNSISLPDKDIIVCIAHVDRVPNTTSFFIAHFNSLPCQTIEFAGNANSALFPSKSQIREILGFLLQNNVDAVLAEYGIVGIRMMEACYKVNIPLIVHFHGFDATRQSYLRKAQQYYPRLFQIAHKIIAPSEFIRNCLIKLGAPESKLCVNHSGGVDLQQFRLSDPAVAPPTFLSIARFLNVKAPHLIILAFSKVLEQHPDAKLKMLGRGNLLESCKQVTRALKISESVEFLGEQPQNVVAQTLHEVRAVVQHSVHTSDGEIEALGLAIVEAGASGIPVIATHSGGVSEIVLHNETGFLVEEFDVDNMARFMLQLAQDPNLAKRLGQAGRERIEQLFTREKSIEELWQIIKLSIQTQRSQIFEQFNLSAVNLICFPAWKSDINQLYSILQRIIFAIFHTPNKSKFNLMIFIPKHLHSEQIDIFISGLVMHILLEEVLEEDTDSTDLAKITLIDEDAPWHYLLEACTARISIKLEDQAIIAQMQTTQLSDLPTLCFREFDLQGELFIGELEQLLKLEQTRSYN